MKLLHYQMGQWRLEHPFRKVPCGDGEFYTDSALIQNNAQGVLWHDGISTSHYSQQVIMPRQNSALILTTSEYSPNAEKALNELSTLLKGQIMAEQRANLHRSARISL